jgi:myosin-5
LLVQAQLLSETQIADNEKQAYVVAQATNEQLTKKLEDAEKKVDQLQDSVQRFVTSLLVEAFGVLSLSFFLGGGGGCYQTYKLGFDVTKLLHVFAILSSSCRLEDKVSNLESENQVLRQQALAISPTAKALTARPKTTIIQVKNACPTFHLDEHLHIDGNVLLIVES